MGTATLDQTARDAVGSACADVRDAEPGDHVDGVAPGLVARPADTDQVAEVLRAAAAHRLTVVPRGRGTKLSWGLPPRSADVLLDVSALDEVLEHAAGDLIVRTQAGTRIADLQEVVGQGGQRLALDETVPGASIGGTLADERQRSASPRHRDCSRPAHRHHRRPRRRGGRQGGRQGGQERGGLRPGQAPDRLVRHPRRRHRGDLPPAPRARCAPLAEHPGGRPGSGPDGGPVGAARAGRPRGDRGRVARARTGGRARPARGPRGRRRRPGRRRTEAARGRDDGVAGRPGGRCDVPLGHHGHRRRPCHLPEADVRTLGACRRTHDGGGDRRCTCVAPPAPEWCTPRSTPGLRSRTSVRRSTGSDETCTEHGGSAVVVDAPAAVKSAVDVWGPIPALDLMRRVKDQFDPDHRLAPGRFVGGI